MNISNKNTFFVVFNDGFVLGMLDADGNAVKLILE